MRRTKIVATLGPATSTRERIREVLEAGVDAARLNFSHGTREEQRNLHANVREVAEEGGKPVPIIQDIQGPKIRVGDLPEGSVELEEGETVTFVPGEAAEPGAIPITYDGLASDVDEGDRILVDDGVYAVQVTAIDGQHVEAEVVHGGTLEEHKGVNLPGVPLSVKPVQEKDRKDLAVGQDLGVDYVAASFVQSPADIAVVRSHVSDDTDVIAKIERQEALTNLAKIIDASDAVLLARGDLGVELPPEEVPVVQKQVLWECHQRGTPSITATQMLESMIRNPRPTRAEASDVANAIFDGTGAVMLSGETATGNHPVEAVATMARIAARAEGARYGEEWTPSRRQELAKRTVPDSIAHASCTVAEDLDVDAIVTPTESGSTAGMVSKYRPEPPVLAVSPHPRTLRQLALYWGVVPLECEEVDEEPELLAEAERVAVESGLVGEGDQVVITAGRVGHPGTTDHLRVADVGELGPGDGPEGT
jgi:pyruvate kinase